jgi:hypothetical protein
MKKIFVLLFLFSSLITFSQKKADSPLVKTWKLKSHTMTGIGKHTSLPKDTQLEFLKDGTWKSTSMWEGSQQGTWNLKEDKKSLRILFEPGDEKEFKISALTDDQLQMESSGKFALYKLTWETLK